MTLQEQITKLQNEKATAIANDDRETYRRVVEELRRLEPLRGNGSTAPVGL